MTRCILISLCAIAWLNFSTTILAQEEESEAVVQVQILMDDDWGWTDWKNWIGWDKLTDFGQSESGLSDVADEDEADPAKPQPPRVLMMFATPPARALAAAYTFSSGPVASASLTSSMDAMDGW